MRIAVQAADLDHARIDGTRVYLLELLKRFGSFAPEAVFSLYHRRAFNHELTPPSFPNYLFRSVSAPFFWMQTRFPWELFRDRPDKIFFPVQAVPFFLPRNTEVTVTVHDLAFRYFPETFPLWDRIKLNLLLDRAVHRAEKLIAVSESTKRDLLHFYPMLDPRKIRVIGHGFDATLFGKKKTDAEITSFLMRYGLRKGNYLLYVGALQPRKNLVRLVQAFDIVRRRHPDMRLVLVGEKAWLADPILDAVSRSEFFQDIILPGRVSFSDLPFLYQGARVFCFPSLYEGFGIPLLEAFASNVPVLTANNSSLPDVSGEAALYCDAFDVSNIAEHLERIWRDENLQRSLIAKGRERLNHFSWDRCAQETIEYILE